MRVKYLTQEHNSVNLARDQTPNVSQISLENAKNINLKATKIDSGTNITLLLNVGKIEKLQTSVT